MNPGRARESEIVMNMKTWSLRFRQAIAAGVLLLVAGTAFAEAVSLTNERHPRAMLAAEDVSRAFDRQGRLLICEQGSRSTPAGQAKL